LGPFKQLLGSVGPIFRSWQQNAVVNIIGKLLGGWNSRALASQDNKSQLHLMQRKNKRNLSLSSQKQPLINV
jgi:hypothetical protein